MRIPYDSLTLCAVTWELQQFVGGKVQRISQPDDFTIGLELYARPDGEEGGLGQLLISCHPVWSRAYLTTRRFANQNQPPAFCSILRSRLMNAKVEAISQTNFDRILELEFDHPSGTYRLVAELMGKHSNIMLVDSEDRILGAAKWVSSKKSVRPVGPNLRYTPPPFDAKPPLFLASPEDDLASFTGASPFLKKLLSVDPDSWRKVRALALNGEAAPVLVPGSGAYPMSVSTIVGGELKRSSISIALDQHFTAAIPAAEADSLRASLLGQLERVVLARDVALTDLRQAEEAGGKAPFWQQRAELILAFGTGSDISGGAVNAIDYEGNSLQISVDPELTVAENANQLFERAKKAKNRLGLVRDQIARISADRESILLFMGRVKETERLIEVRELESEARKRRWLNKVVVNSPHKEDRPYQGHRIRELLAPGGWTILYGENAESNDYLTLRVARPTDYWLHVRGHTSAHVVIVTKNQPERVSRETLEFAAKVAVKHSPTKHSGYVPVDYTLKKYVRRQNGAPKGAAIYTHEKTLHVNG